MRFYDNNGIEIDVQDIKFFINEKKLTETQEAIAEMLELYEENLSVG